MTTHIPVLQKEVIQYLNPKPNEDFIDATIGSGGHAFEILKLTRPEGKLLGIDLDRSAIDDLRKKITNQENERRLILVCDNFANLKKIINQNNFQPVQGILADLGMSSVQLEESGRGFSFLKDEILDMRFGDKSLTAEDLVNNLSAQDLEKIFREYGEERFAKQIAKKITEQRKASPIKTTLQLVEVIKQAIPNFYLHGRIHPATRIFQALRIAVNDELNNLIKFLPQAIDVLGKGGRLTIISFHSLEDRIVKKFFKEKNQQNLIKILTKKVIRPAFEEIQKNPRSRSARLRAIIKI